MSIESELAKRDRLLAEKSARIRELEAQLEERTCKRFWTGAEMICSRCAHQLNDATANYCPNCGARVVGE